MFGKKAWIGTVALILVIVVVAAVARHEVRKKKTRREKPKSSERFQPKMELLPADRTSARRQVVYALQRAQEQQDFRQAAFLNSLLAQEALERSRRTLKAWEERRDAETGLVPRELSRGMDFWNAKDTAADMFPFLLIASHFLDPSGEMLWLEAMKTERRLCGPLPCMIRFKPANVEEETTRARIFGASEYAKDGLLAVAERLGRGPWFERLEEVAQAILGAADIRTTRGLMAASTAEVNGDLLQVLSRLAWATGNDKYIEMAERIADTYLFDILPANGDLPAEDWDFVRGAATTSTLRLRDHGNEIIPGLSEAYFLEKLRGRPRAQQYREPLKNMLDAVLETGRTPDGLWADRVDLGTRKSLNDTVCDNWGYLLNAYMTFDLAEGTSVYTEEVRRAMRGAAARKSFEWEKRSHDGYADSLESMLYALAWQDLPEGRLWLDDEMEVMFAVQSPNGIVSGRYLDGNFIRTAMLYAGYKMQGIVTDPWTDQVRLGAAWDASAGKLTVFLSADPKWSGKLRFDPPRHRLTWKLPRNYPRLNATPEWFVVEPERTYIVTDLTTGGETEHAGVELARGLKIDPDPRNLSRWLTVAEKRTDK